MDRSLLNDPSIKRAIMRELLIPSPQVGELYHTLFGSTFNSVVISGPEVDAAMRESIRLLSEEGIERPVTDGSLGYSPIPQGAYA